MCRVPVEHWREADSPYHGIPEDLARNGSEIALQNVLLPDLHRISMSMSRIGVAELGNHLRQPAHKENKDGFRGIDATAARRGKH